jgi:hypothetical protein
MVAIQDRLWPWGLGSVWITHGVSNFETNIVGTR